MAHIAFSDTDARPWSALLSFAAGIGRAFALTGSLSERMQRIEALQRLSDAELAARGITRDRIPHHVFADLYGF